MKIMYPTGISNGKFRVNNRRKVILDSAAGQCLEHATCRVERGSGDVMDNRA